MMDDASPSKYAYSITPDDDEDLPRAIRAFSIVTGGDVKVTRVDGTTDTLPLPAGLWPLAVSRIWATGTTAVGFVGFA